MKLHLTTAENQNLITGYGAGFVEINHARHSQHVLVMPSKLLQGWHVGDFKALTEQSFDFLLDAKPEVVLLGTGESHQFLHPKIYQNLTAQGIPLECMTTAAACRTYNILMAEGRNVAAAILL